MTGMKKMTGMLPLQCSCSDSFSDQSTVPEDHVIEDIFIFQKSSEGEEPVMVTFIQLVFEWSHFVNPCISDIRTGNPSCIIFSSKLM